MHAWCHCRKSVEMLTKLTTVSSCMKDGCPGCLGATTEISLPQDRGSYRGVSGMARTEKIEDHGSRVSQVMKIRK